MVNSKILKNIKSIQSSFLNSSESASKNAVLLMKNSYSCQQVHKNKAILINNERFYLGVDGLISAKKSRLVIRTADCMPVFLYDAENKVIAALHAGWKGLLSGIIDNTCEELMRIRCDMKKIIVSIGPHIGVCCYEVKKDIIDKFTNKLKIKDGFYSVTKRKINLDLFKIAKIQLQKNGILDSNIEDVDVCTMCNLDFASFRREKTDQRNYNFLRQL